MYCRIKNPGKVNCQSIGIVIVVDFSLVAFIFHDALRYPIQSNSSVSYFVNVRVWEKECFKRCFKMFSWLLLYFWFYVRQMKSGILIFIIFFRLCWIIRTFEILSEKIFKIIHLCYRNRYPFQRNITLLNCDEIHGDNLSSSIL